MGRGRRGGGAKKSSNNKLRAEEEEIENREGDELTGVPWIHVAGAEIPRWRLASRDGGSSPASGGGGSSPVAGEQRAGDAPSPRRDAARGAAVRELQVGHRDRGTCACVIGLGRIDKAHT